MAAALDRAGIKHAVIGGNAIAASFARVTSGGAKHEGRGHFGPARGLRTLAIKAAQAVGFVYRNVAGVDLFLDGPEGSVRSGFMLSSRERVPLNTSSPPRM